MTLAASYLWTSSLPLALIGTLLAAFGLGGLTSPRRVSTHPEHEPHLQGLWETARHLSADRVLTDPATGNRLWVERFRGFVTLAVADPDEPDADRAATVTRYMLAFGRRPLPAPLFRHLTPLHDAAAATMSWRQAREVLRLADQTGTADTTLAELIELCAQLDRAVAAIGDEP
ncbi:hypothetical protein GCM10010191_88760 [Actinomadura vinacea]|uniref:Uncharacterized protein n=1 Tax=Actinomadura vinacea TaxID=115336 RepID=A0ABN3KFV0_9ACTN